MGHYTASIVGKEQLILLPFEEHRYNLHTDSSVLVEMRTGRHSVVVSGYAEFTSMDGTSPREMYVSNTASFHIHDAADDNDLFEHTIKLIVGPEWRDLVQVSADVSRAGISSHESDEVDRSHWVVRNCSWQAVFINGRERIQLTINLETRGELNGWTNLGYQVVATGNLMRMPSPDEISADIPSS